MSKTRLITIVGIISIAAIVAVSVPLVPAKAEDGNGNHDKMDMKEHMEVKPLTLEKIHSGHLPMVSQSIDNAIKALESDKKETALAELNKAKHLITGINEAIGKLVKPNFANVRCPIMNSPINPEKVTKDLIREYKGQKIAFCCGGCPAAWDKLTDAEKTAKLAKVNPTIQKIWTCSMHPQIKQPKQGLCPLCNMKLVPLSIQ